MHAALVPRVRAASLTLLLATGAACAASDGADHDPSALRHEAARAAASPGDAAVSTDPTSNAVALPGLNATVTATVSTSGGTLCAQAYPWLSESGAELSLGYDANELNIEPPQQSARLRCTAKVAIASSAPVSFAVSRLYAQGYTVLGRGMAANLSLHFQDPQGASRRTRRVVEGVGEYHAFRLDQAFPAEALAWSRCARRGEVTLETLFQLSNSTPPQSGTVDMCNTDVGGKPPSLAGLTFVWRACTEDASADPARP